MAEREHDLYLLILLESNSSARLSGLAIPFGQETTPSFQAASIHVLGRPPGSKATGPLPLDDNRDHQRGRRAPWEVRIRVCATWSTTALP
jgi:hypothetical protein